MADYEDPVVDVEEYAEDIVDNVPVDDDEDEFPTDTAEEVKLFGKWSFADIEVRDMSVQVSA